MSARVTIRNSRARVQVVAGGRISTGTGGGVTDGDKGDVTVSASGATWTVDAVGGQTAAAVAAHVAVAHQPLDADLTALAALSGTGWAQRTDDSTWAVTIPTYTDVGADAAGTAESLISLHEVAADPHPDYLTEAEAAATYAALPTVQTLADGASITCDWSAGEVATVTLGGHRTIAMSGGDAGRIYTLVIVQDGTGDRSLEYGSEVPVRPEHRRQAGQATVHRYYCDGSSYHILGPSPWIWLPCTTNTTHSVAATRASVTGCQWTPVPGATYAVSGRLAVYAASLTTGCQPAWVGGGATSGAIRFATVGTTSATEVIRNLGVGATSIAAGSSVSSTTLPQTLVTYEGVFTAPASPTACGLEFTTEVDGSAVTVAAGLSGLWIRRLA